MDYLAGAISKKRHNVETFSVRETKPDSLPLADLYVFSTPTQIGSPARKMKKFLKNLEVKQEGAKYALMAIYMDPKAKSLQKMEEFLQPTEMTKASECVKIKVTGMKGPLESDYEGKLDAFAKEILS